MKKDGQEIGELIRELRKAKGMTQMQLSESIGVSYQQIQKYEKSGDTISVQRLKQMSKALAVPIGVFFSAGSGMVAETPARYGRMQEDQSLLLELYAGIKDRKVKKAVLEFLKILATH